jgi:phage/plasmid-like protein (TIGR03299 family)|tara:strand:- start:2260 stop:3204 length:945 start_codon:yes stop_codon:yes gene_type:complete
MAHEVEKMVFAGAVPWHGLGTEIDQDTGFWEAFDSAGLNWEVDTKPLFTGEGEQVSHRAAYRTSDNRILGIVGKRWTPLQNRDAFEIFEPLVDAGEMVIHTAGSLRNGERIWALCQLNQDNSEIVRGDEIAKFVLLSNGHDGKLAVHFGFTPIRVVCANTEALARGSKASKLIRVRHSRFVKQNVQQLRDVMNFANQEFEATAQQYRHLASKGINSEDLEKYIKIVLGVDKKSDDEISTRSKNIVLQVTQLFENGRGADIAGVRGTYWGAYNAVTEYLNYSKGRTSNNRMDSMWFGQNGVMSQKALDTALELSA